MGNMSYCRFENTVNDLQDCYDALNEAKIEGTDDLSEREARAKKRLIELCKDIAEEFETEE